MHCIDNNIDIALIDMLNMRLQKKRCAIGVLYYLTAKVAIVRHTDHRLITNFNFRIQKHVARSLKHAARSLKSAARSLKSAA